MTQVITALFSVRFACFINALRWCVDYRAALDLAERSPFVTILPRDSCTCEPLLCAHVAFARAVLSWPCYLFVRTPALLQPFLRDLDLADVQFAVRACLLCDMQDKAASTFAHVGLASAFGYFAQWAPQSVAPHLHGVISAY